MWEAELAKALKDNTMGAENNAVGKAVMTVGTIESVSPLIVSAFDGEAIYMDEEGEIVITRTFSQYSTAKKNCVISNLKGTVTCSGDRCSPVIKDGTATCNGAHCTPNIKKGSQVLIAPVGSLNRIALIDLIGG